MSLEVMIVVLMGIVKIKGCISSYRTPLLKQKVEKNRFLRNICGKNIFRLLAEFQIDFNWQALLD